MKTQSIFLPATWSFDILGLTEHEMDTVLTCLKHCSGGHLEIKDPDGYYTPGRMFNKLSALVAQEKRNRQ